MPSRRYVAQSSLNDNSATSGQKQKPLSISISTPFASSSAIREDSCTEDPDSYRPSATAGRSDVPNRSVFYPLGLEREAPVILHYLQLGRWRTRVAGSDYFIHRRRRIGEVVGHTVRWLFNTKPRDRFVFIVDPVDDFLLHNDENDNDQDSASKLDNTASRGGRARRHPLRRLSLRWEGLQRRLFGAPPAFACDRQGLAKRCWVSSSSPSSSSDNDKDDSLRQPLSSSLPRFSHHHAVESIEVLHADLTALDYAPRLHSRCFSMEAKVVRSYLFPSLRTALEHYGCGADLQAIRARHSAGISAQIPQQPLDLNRTKGDRAKQQTRRVQSASSRWSSERAKGGSPRLVSTHREVVLSVFSADPLFDEVLREVLLPEAGSFPYAVSAAAQRRLLAMCESGIPRWAFLPGLPCRRFLYGLHVVLTNLGPLVAFAAGFYDLYWHLPQFTTVIARGLEPLARVVEARLALRRSVLATYLLSALWTSGDGLARVLSQLYLLQAFGALYSLLQLPLRVLWGVTGAFYSLLQFPLRVLWGVTGALCSLLQLPLRVLWGVTGALSNVFGLLYATTWALLTAIAWLVAMVRDVLGMKGMSGVEGISSTFGWWREFWLTIVSPVKNAVKGCWYAALYVIHVITRHEASIRQWYSPTVTCITRTMEAVKETMLKKAERWRRQILSKIILIGIAVLASSICLSGFYYFKPQPILEK
ncbi:unnamed protein product [Phytomonas sp. Hart1]|nr:unnamed protein product [Phytomonas sp. Hart1]|eukprot:CCW72192.1 unnamed protein product [Phytomonas sp. isolate Hart1]